MVSSVVLSILTPGRNQSLQLFHLTKLAFRTHETRLAVAFPLQLLAPTILLCLGEFGCSRYLIQREAYGIYLFCDLVPFACLQGSSTW